MDHLEIPVVKLRLLLVMSVAIGMTLAAEFFYLTIWGLWFFPDGNLVSKMVWSLVCGLGMGAVIACATLAFVEGVFEGAKAILIAASIVALVGTLCAILCWQIDLNFNYFGGDTHSQFFVISGIVPAIFGGMFYGWLLYSSRFFSFQDKYQIMDE